MSEESMQQVRKTDEQIFKGSVPVFTIPEQSTFEPLHKMKEKAEYLIDRMPADFITRELMFNLSEIESVSSDISSITEEEIKELENMSDEEGMNDAVNNKTIRELFYALAIEKNFHKKSQKIDQFIDITAAEEGVDVQSEDGSIDKEVGRKQAEECLEPGEEEYRTLRKWARPSVMDLGKDDFDMYMKEDHVALLVDLFQKSHLDSLIGDNIQCPEDNIKDCIGCKSLRTIFDESALAEESRMHSIDCIICIFKYYNHPLKDNEMPIEQEITEMINNLNNNTIKPAEGLYSQIKGCVIVNRGLGILILEISLFDLIRMMSSLDWSCFKQKMLQIRILSNISNIKSRFSFFMTCRAYFDENDTRQLPDPEKCARRLEQNNKVYLAKVQKYFTEISNKIDFTIKLLQHQAETHLCGIGELPPCAAQHLPSRRLLEWALEVPYLQSWSDLVNDVMQPAEFFDHTADSYPAPTDMYNLRSLYIMDQFKDYLPLFFRKGFRPEFDESVLPQIIVPEVCRQEAEELFVGKSLLFVENEDDQRNFDKLT